MSNDADQILPHLWLGNSNSSQNYDFIQRNRIHVIINCSKDLPFLPINTTYKYRIPVHDNLEHDELVAMGKWIPKILPVIERYYQGDSNILIHCAAGMQRSAIITLCFLCYHFKCDPKSAFLYMRKKRPIVFRPYMNFALSFRMYYGDEMYKQLVS